MKFTKRRILLIAIVAGILIVLALLPKNKMGRPAMHEETENIVSVTSQTVQKTDVQEYLKMNGSVQADNTISVYPDISGKIIKTYVSLGSTVKRGDIIADIDPSTPGSVYSKSSVTAPIDGTITSLPLTIGTSVSTSTEVAQIGDIHRLQIKANVPERDIAPLKVGLSAIVSLEAYPGVIFSAHVSKVSPVVDETSRSKEIYYFFDTNDERINAGMYVKIKLDTTLHKDVLAINVDAITTIDGKSYVYVINQDNTVSAREVTLGTSVDNVTIILSGLAEGEQVVTAGIQALTDGSKIRVIGA